MHSTVGSKRSLIFALIPRAPLIVVGGDLLGNVAQPLVADESGDDGIARQEKLTALRPVMQVCVRRRQ